MARQFPLRGHGFGEHGSVAGVVGSGGVVGVGLGVVVGGGVGSGVVVGGEVGSGVSGVRHKFTHVELQ